ncbi:MAG: hypothetical protein JWO57_4240 [Pseudonocardiales bacterium]|nr:hypothetical protein [Pseudonocardiales bacterium]
MLHPVGSLPPSVYWRRRLTLLGALVVLVVLTAWVLRPNSNKNNAAAGAGHSSSSSSNAALSTSSAPTTSHPATTHSASSSTTTPSASTTQKGSATHAAAPGPCKTSQLKVAAVAGKASYHVGDQPVVMLQVTNAGAAPCVQDLADRQVELRVYNGESRVWGSHDCEVQSGTAARTLAVGQPVRVSIVWSGLSSQANCAGTRQRVGAGTYTLYALLSGRAGAAAQFSIS